MRAKTSLYDPYDYGLQTCNNKFYNVMQTCEDKLITKKIYNRIECLKLDFMKEEFRVIVDHHTQR